MLAMLNPVLVCARAQAAKSKNKKVDRTLKFYYLYCLQNPAWRSFAARKSR